MVIEGGCRGGFDSNDGWRKGFAKTTKQSDTHGLMG